MHSPGVGAGSLGSWAYEYWATGSLDSHTLDPSWQTLLVAGELEAVGVSQEVTDVASGKDGSTWRLSLLNLLSGLIRGLSLVNTHLPVCHDRLWSEGLVFGVVIKHCLGHRS